MFRKQRITLSFCLKGYSETYNSVQAYNSVDCQKYSILMSPGRNSKTNKAAESKLVLGAEFLSITFSFDRSSLLCCIASEF